MIIKETQLREIIKEELLSEFFGPFKRKKKPKKMFLSKDALAKHKKNAALSKTSGIQITDFFKRLENAKAKIRKLKSVLLKLRKGNKLGFDFLEATGEVLEADRGLDEFENKVFPLISKLAKLLKEEKEVNEISIMMDEEILILGSIFAKEFSNIDELASISDRDLANYMSALSDDEKKSKESLVQFYASVFRYIAKNRSSINKIVDKKMRQIKSANEKLGGRKLNRTQKQATKKPSAPSYKPSKSPELKSAPTMASNRHDSEGYKRLSMSNKPEGSTDLWIKKI